MLGFRKLFFYISKSWNMPRNIFHMSKNAEQRFIPLSRSASMKSRPFHLPAEHASPMRRKFHFSKKQRAQVTWIAGRFLLHSSKNFGQRKRQAWMPRPCQNWRLSRRSALAQRLCHKYSSLQQKLQSREKPSWRSTVPSLQLLQTSIISDFGNLLQFAYLCLSLDDGVCRMTGILAFPWKIHRLLHKWTPQTIYIYIYI